MNSRDREQAVGITPPFDTPAALAASGAAGELNRHDRLIRDIVIILQHELRPPRHLYTLVRRAAGKIAERTSGENL